MSMIAKTTGLGATIISNKKKLGKLNFVMFSGRFARWKDRKNEEEVDILVVGSIDLPELANMVRAEESRRGIEINYTAMTWEEYQYRKKRRDPFLMSILASSRVMIIGDEDVLVS